MFSRLFGNYLLDQQVISNDILQKIYWEQNSTRAKLGVIAVAESYMTQEQADEINHIQIQMDKRFGDIAIEKGYLTNEQVSVLLNKQGSPYMKFLQILTQMTDITVEQAEEYLKQFQKKEGFNDAEMEALKCDDIDKIVPIYAFSSKPFITDITALVLRNITRFITTDYYIGTIHHVAEYEYAGMIGQQLVGDHQIHIAFTGAKDDIGGLKTLAKCYATDDQENRTTDSNQLDEIEVDTIAEFANVCSGLIAIEFAQKKVNVDMQPPFAYKNQKAVGSAYIIPIYINGSKLELYLAVDSDITLGNTPFEFHMEKKEGSTVKAESKGSIMIVDDSAMMRRVLRNIIEEAGYTVIAEAVNGKDAIASYQSCKPDLVTMDITMPEMDGVEALKEIIEIDKQAKVIMITAAGQQHKVIEALKLGALKFIMKPFRKEEVLAGLNEVI